MRYVFREDAEEFILSLKDQSVHLIATDPPYFNTVNHAWDRQWPSVSAYARWLSNLFGLALRKLAPDGSIVFFGAIGKHGERPLFEVMRELETFTSYHYRNMITWKKRRAYGKSHDYLFCREEILWYSVSPERTSVRFNVPLSTEKRGYAGFNAKYPAKSEYKRISNVWDDIPELMRPERACQKPVPLMRRIIETHSHRGDLVVDFFAGWGTTGVAAAESGRRFLGCDAGDDASIANERVEAAMSRGAHELQEPTETVRRRR